MIINHHHHLFLLLYDDSNHHSKKARVRSSARRSSGGPRAFLPREVVGYAHQARAVLHYCAMFQAKYDYKPVKMEFGWHRKALDACMVGDLAKLKLVVKNRSKEVGYRVNINDVYDEDFWGCSCLHRAAENGHYEVLVYLIEKLNHDVLTVANDKTTASWQAWFFGHKKCYHYLKKQEHIQSSSKTPLQQRIHTNNNL